MSWRFTIIVPVALALAALPHAAGQVSTVVVGVAGEAEPGGNGRFATFSDPTVNDAGAVAFSAVLSETTGGNVDNSGVYRFAGGAVQQVAREAQLVGDGNIRLGDFFSVTPTLSGNGNVAFSAALRNTPGGSADNSGIYRSDGSTLIELARAGTGSFTAEDFAYPSMNSSGVTVFLSETQNAITRLYVHDGSGITRIADDDTQAPGGGTARLDLISPNPCINSGNTVVFRSGLFPSGGGEYPAQGIFRSSAGQLTEVTRSTRTIPGEGRIAAVSEPSLNDSGQIAFRAALTLLGGGSSQGVYRYSNTGSIQIARFGQPAPPEIGGTISTIDEAPPGLNNSGAVSFKASVRRADGVFEAGVFRAANGQLKPVARQFAVVPGSNDRFAAFGDVSINDAGHIAFLGFVNTDAFGGPGDRGIYLYDDDLGIVQLAREGDPLLGSTIIAVDLPTGVGGRAYGRSPLNNYGQVTYRFFLQDGRSGIAVASIPEPSLLCLGFLARLLHRNVSPSRRGFRSVRS